MAKIYPRLESFEYEEQIEYVEKLQEEKGSYTYTPSDSDLHWLPMGNRVDLNEIKQLRFNIISFMHSENLGPVASAQERTTFDKKLGMKLLEWLDITPSIAADNGMWAYLNIVLIPDLVKIRWGYSEKGESHPINHERYYDTSRAYLKKLWITAYLINDEELYSKLKQDEIDVWYDKTYNRGFDNYIQNIFNSFYRNVENYNIRSDLHELYRQFLKLINRKLAYINYYALDENSLSNLFDICFKTVYEDSKKTQSNSPVANTVSTKKKVVIKKKN